MLLLRILVLVFVSLALLRPTASLYTGTVASIDVKGGRLLIDRDAVSEDAPVTRMSFVYTGQGNLGTFKLRDRVGFAARHSDRGSEVSGIWLLPTAPVTGDNPELEFGHHHNPHHDGIVGMVGEYHVEAVAARDGVVRAYISDISRRPLSLRGIFGKAILYDGDRTVTRALGRMSSNTGPALGARFDEFETDQVTVEFDLVRGDESINVEFILPLARAARRKPQMPKRCDSSQRPEYYAVSKPWCAMDFGRPVAALDLSPAGEFLVVAPVDLPTTAWTLPDGKRRAQFKPAPEMEPAPGRNEHAEAPTAVIPLPPDGAEAVLVKENRFLRYATDTGRLLGEWPAADGLVLDARWLPAARALFASIADRPYLARVDPSAEAFAVSVEMQKNIDAFAVNPSDGRVALADSEGLVTVVGVVGGAEQVAMSTRLPRVSSLAFAGEYLAATSKDGIVRVWHAATGGQVGERGRMPPQLQIVSDPSGRRVLAGDAKGGLRLFTVPALRPGLELEFHREAISGLAWAGESMLSGDTAGRVAVWRFAPPGK